MQNNELIANVVNEFKVEYPELKYHATNHTLQQ